MESSKFKGIVRELNVKFREIIKTQTYAPYSVLDASERPTGQYWVVSAVYSMINPDEYIDSVLFNFKRSDLTDDYSSDPNEFFSINDKLLEELTALNKKGNLNSLLPVFLEAEKECKEEEYVLIDIKARFASEDDFRKRLLEEYVCIIYPYESSVLVDCMQDERKRVLIPCGDRNIPYMIPSEKVELFPHVLQEPAIHGPSEKEDYIFVLMSFDKDPSLDDAYDAVVRGVGRWNPKAIVDRVDKIPEDFKITDKIVECIDRAAVVIADLTGEKPNVYYELGYARAKGKRIIQTAKKGTKLHFDVMEHNTILWDGVRELEKELTIRLSPMLRKSS